MLNHTKQIKEIYEEIQRKLLYMIPEKWESIYLYSSIIENSKKKLTGELFFYYIPKGIFRKNPVNVYEVPSKFNIDENQYLQLVSQIYDDIKLLREEFKKSEPEEMWSNITISITNMKFKAEYSYEDLVNNTFNSYERHVIWRYKYLGIGPEQVSKKDKDILFRYFNGARNLAEVEEYSAGIYVEQDTRNIIEYNTEQDEILNDGYIREDEQEIVTERKYNQIKSHKIENNWDSRRKKKTETMWSNYYNTSLEQYVIKASENNKTRNYKEEIPEKKVSNNILQIPNLNNQQRTKQNEYNNIMTKKEKQQKDEPKVQVKWKNELIHEKSINRQNVKDKQSKINMQEEKIDRKKRNQILLFAEDEEEEE